MCLNVESRERIMSAILTNRRIPADNLGFKNHLDHLAYCAACRERINRLIFLRSCGQANDSYPALVSNKKGELSIEFKIKICSVCGRALSACVCGGEQITLSNGGE